MVAKAFENWLKMSNSPQIFWLIQNLRNLRNFCLWKFLYLRFYLEKIWENITFEKTESTLLISVTETLVHVRRSYVLLSKHSVHAIFFFFIVWKSSSIMRILLSSLAKNFTNSLGTSDLGDLWFYLRNLSLPSLQLWWNFGSTSLHPRKPADIF